MPVASTFETEINKAPALRISHIVRDPINTDGRVRYLIDPDGRCGERAIPEDVVLTRWRQRVMTGYSFHGCRLGPNLWRAIGRGLGMDAQSLCNLHISQISRAREELHRGTKEHYLKLPDPSALIELFTLLRPERLQIILDRHHDPDRVGRFGTPDLFLFARSLSERRSGVLRLVEVKKPGERISPDQHEEIAFLRSIGIPARVLRLIERKG